MEGANPNQVIVPGSQPGQAQGPVQQSPAPVMPPLPSGRPRTTVRLEGAEHGTDGSITWSASEFAEHNKNAGWFLLLIFGAIVAAALTYFITKSRLSAAVIIVAAFVIGVMANHKPRTLRYRLDEAGLTVENRFYEYNQFRSFTIIDEHGYSSINLQPLRRLLPPMTIYYAPNDESAIASLLASYLPVEEKHFDPVDNLMRRIRF